MHSAQPSVDAGQAEILALLEQVFEAANPSEDEDYLLLEWFFNTRAAQIRQLHADGLNALADIEHQKLKRSYTLRKYESFDGTLVRPGDLVFCDDWDHDNYDCGGKVLGYNEKDGTYTVEFKYCSEQMSPMRLWPDADTCEQQAKYAEKWTKNHLIGLLDLAPTAKVSLDKRLSVFFCHASEDKDRVRSLYSKLRLDGFRPWLDTESLAAGDEWENVTRRDIHEPDIVLVCLSAVLTTKIGFVQTEIEFALDAARGRPSIERYIVPVFIEDCNLLERLGAWNAVRSSNQMATRNLSQHCENAHAHCAARLSET